jgi:hypothetical protein
MRIAGMHGGGGSPMLTRATFADGWQTRDARLESAHHTAVANARGPTYAPAGRPDQALIMARRRAAATRRARRAPTSRSRTTTPARRARSTAPRPIITFTSDFGHEDWFVGVVHGVIHAACPEARVVDLTHDIPPGHIARAAFVLEASAPDFPPGTVHLAVVDPGVGTDRRPLAIAARGQFFVGPDNGLLEWALSDATAQVHAVTAAQHFRYPVSRTFHARDVFAPVAAHLACGEPIARLGNRIDGAIRIPRPIPRRVDGLLVGRVMFVDHFGNALTNLTEQDLSDAFPMVRESALGVRVAGRVIRGLGRAYGESKAGTLMAILGSSGRLEIAQVGGDAAERLGLGEGDEVAVGVGDTLVAGRND